MVGVRCSAAVLLRWGEQAGTPIEHPFRLGEAGSDGTDVLGGARGGASVV